MSNEKILGVIGPLTSSNALESGYIFQQGKTVLITSSATNPKIPELGNYIFRTCPSDDSQGKNLAEFTVNTLGHKKIGVFYQADEAYSKGLAEIYMQEAVRLGGEIVAINFFNKADNLDFSSQISSFKEEAPEAIFLPLYPKEAAFFSQQAEKDGLKFQLIGGDGLSNESFISLGGESVENAFVSAFFDTSFPSSGVQLFNKNFETFYYKDPNWLSAYAFDTANLLRNAIKESKSKDREDIRNILSRNSTDGVTGHISFDQNGGRKETQMIYMEVKEGKWNIFLK